MKNNTRRVDNTHRYLRLFESRRHKHKSSLIFYLTMLPNKSNPRLRRGLDKIILHSQSVHIRCFFVEKYLNTFLCLPSELLKHQLLIFTSSYVVDIGRYALQNCLGQWGLYVERIDII